MSTPEGQTPPDVHINLDAPATPGQPPPPRDELEPQFEQWRGYVRQRRELASACVSSTRASLSSTAPSSVSATLRVVRVISRVPRSSSSNRMKRQSADGSM